MMGISHQDSVHKTVIIVFTLAFHTHTHSLSHFILSSFHLTRVWPSGHTELHVHTARGAYVAFCSRNNSLVIT